MSAAALARIDWGGWLARHAIWVVLVVMLVVAALASDAFLRPIYLFNVVRDPNEKRDFKAEHPERLEELKSFFREWETQMLVPVSLEGRPQGSATKDQDV